MSKSWPGEADMVSAFQELQDAADGKGSLTNSVKIAVKMCLQHQKEYKMVVFEVERFMIKANEAGRMGAIYVMDSLCRKEATGKSKESFCTRFASRMKQIFMHFEGISENNRLVVAKIVYQWRKRAVFASDCLPRYDDLKDVIESGSSTSSKSDFVSNAEAPITEPSPTEDGTKTDKQSEKLSTKSKVVTKKNVPKKAIRFCAFREGSCPFGDKCRFSHVEPGAQGQYMITRGGIKKQPLQTEDAREYFDYGRIESADLPSAKEITSVGMTVLDTAFPVKRKEQKEESVYFKRHKLAHSFATQDYVEFSWINSKSLESLLQK
jgi:hypothetical protein